MAEKSKQKFGAVDTDTHHLLLLKEPPDSLIAFRKELLNHPDLLAAGQSGATFEEAIGNIAAKLDIAMDGLYEVGPLCEMLTDVLKKRNTLHNLPHLRHSSLIDVELLEKEGTVEIAERDRNLTTILPDGGIITDTSSSNKKSPVPIVETGDKS